MIDITLLRCLTTREKFEKYLPAIPKEALEERTRLLVSDIERYYKEFDTQESIDFIIFRDLFFRWHPRLNKEQQSFYDKLLLRVDDEVPEEIEAALMQSLNELRFATEAGNLLREYDNGAELNIIEEMDNLATSAGERVTQSLEWEVPEIDFAELVKADEDVSGMQWRPDTGIGEVLRPLRDGDFIIVAGRPDKGKTSFIADTATYFAAQQEDNDGELPRPVLWLSNEGVRENIVKRAIQSSINCTVGDLVNKQQEGTLRGEYIDAVGSADALQVVDITGYTNYEVKGIVEKVNPKLLIIDMIDKVHWLGLNKDGRTDQQLEEKYSWFRELGIMNKFATIATSQISHSACENDMTQMWPMDHMLKDSKTGKQGACDAIIMIGHSEDPMKKGYRFLSAPKNKLKMSGTADLQQTVLFDQDRARFTKV